ncbi:MAG: 6-carboxytetrahydropterin synthase QueD [Victivallaceae bacterium]|nr:6-carboxytetrahydropterin synthase QueD [Victivallaceae bacterium]
MFEVEVTRTISAAHALRGYDGKCQNLHGHNYVVSVVVGADKVDDIGLSVDFTRLKAELDEILKAYDHHNLSELPEFQEVNPSSEMLAVHIYRAIASRMNGDGVRVLRTKVCESDHSSVTYSE